DIFGDPPSVLDPRCPFGDGRKEGGEVDLLETLAAAFASCDVADEEDHRGGILESDMNARAGIGRTGAAGDEGDTRAASHPAVRVGHISDPAFLAADDGLDLFHVVEGVEHREEALARHGEDAVAALD